jgi:lipopolysaccharide transport system ATP-binding protein
MSDIAIKVENLSKCYPIFDTPRDRLKQMIIHRVVRLVGAPKPKKYYREFWALKDVSFQVKKGESIGIIGRNGSGKSTLLQLICGTLSPTAGYVQTNGRVAALLELGAGFNPEFSGRDNVYLNASLLGLSNEEIESSFDEILAFADIGQFIDQPVKTYSSGMVVRLAFAVQSQIKPDILIVDEALAVGDAKFQVKCFERLRQLKENGTSILLVTHSSEQIVTHCSIAMLLDGGIKLMIGEPKGVANRYMELLFGKEKLSKHDALEQALELPGEGISTISYQLSQLEDNFHTRNGYNPHEYRWGDGAATIIDYYLASGKEQYPSAICTGQPITLSLSVKFNRDLYRPIFGVTIKTKEGISVYGVNSETLKNEQLKNLIKMGSVIQIETMFVCRLAPGDYFVSLGVASKYGEEVIPHDRRYDSIHLHVMPNSTFFGIADLELTMDANEIKGMA